LGADATTKGWMVMVMSKRARMGANASTKLGQDELLWVNDDVVIVDVDSLKPQYWGTYNEE
jgi:hypothetical protein